MEDLKKICVKNACVFDPSQDWRGEHRDIFMARGKISTPFNDPDHVIEADGRVAMAGGVDPNCCFVLPGQIFMRLFDGIPDGETIGRAYARLGYVHAHQPFATLLMAGEVRRFLSRIPFLDTSFRVALDYRDVGKHIKTGKHAEFCAEAKAIIHLTGAIGLFLPFPFLKHKQTYYIQKNVSAKKTFEFLGSLDDPDMFPIAVWGMPGLLATKMPMAEGLVISGVNGALESEEALENAVEFLESGGNADIGLNHGRAHLTVDCDNRFRRGAISMDAGIHNSFSLGYRSATDELKDDASAREWTLLSREGRSGRLSLSSLSPPSGSGDRIPMAMSWIHGRDSCPREIENALAKDDFSLSDIAMMTRLAPARQLGFDDIGHLKTGAVAHVALYDLMPDGEKKGRSKAFSNCWCLIKGGRPVIQNGNFTGVMADSEIRCRKMNVDIERIRHAALLQNPTLRLENLAVIQDCSGVASRENPVSCNGNS